MKRAKFLLLSLSFVATAACSAASTSTDDGPTNRGPLGKADHAGSCQSDGDDDFCGGKSDGTCWCDDQCAMFGDCCADVGDTCNGDVPDQELCMGDNHCDDDQVCDDSVCLSNCPAGAICPAVCWGQCVDGGDDDDDNGGGGSCEDACGGEADGCWCDDQCDAFGDCCDDKEDVCDGDPPPFGECTDGSVALCEIVPPTCPDGLVLSVVNNCFGPCVDPETCEPPEQTTCEILLEDFAAETAAIRSCETADECGQVLAGTSCGCTRNWVARNDADIADWTEIREKANANGCSIPGTISTCDCPFADGFACENNICQFNLTSG